MVTAHSTHRRPSHDRRQRTLLGLSIRGLVAGILLFGSMTLVTSPVKAHASLLDSSPAPGAALPEAPNEVRLIFSERVTVIDDTVRVFDRSGQRVDVADARLDGAEVVAASLQPDLPDGGYLVSWQVVSADGHLVRGSFSFTVGDGEALDDDTVAGLIGSGPAPIWDLLGWVTRALSYLGALLGAGIALLYCRVPQPGSPAVGLRLWVRAAAWTGLAAIIANVLVQGVRLTGGGIDALADPDAIEVALRQGGAWTGLVSGAGLMVLMIAAGPSGLRWWSPGSRLPIMASAAIASAGGFGLSGHAVTSEPRALVIAANALHGVAAAVWLGGLVAVALLLRRQSASGPEPQEARRWQAEVVARFSSMAALSLGAVAVTGVLVAWRIEGSWSGVLAGTRGTVLLAKVLVVAVVAALGGWNRARLVPSVERHAATLRRVVTVEAALLAVVVGLTASLVIMAPNRASSSSAKSGLASEVVRVDTPDGDRVDLRIVVEPGRSGENTVVVTIGSNREAAREVTEVRLRLTQEEVGVGPIRAGAVPAGAGTWRSEAVNLPVGGAWTIEIFLATAAGVASGVATVTLP